MRKVEYKDTEIAVKKKLGQNFLTDRNITRKIVAASGVAPEENILEIGPGFGALTREIIDVCPAFTVIEKDRRLAEFIRTEYPQLTLIEGDFLEIDLNPLAEEKPLRVLGNIPVQLLSEVGKCSSWQAITARTLTTCGSQAAGSRGLCRHHRPGGLAAGCPVS